MAYLNAVLLAIVEGLTEFLPISSTGHLILCEKYLPLTTKTFADTFIVLIQLPAILAVAVYFWGDLWPAWRDATRRNATLLLWAKVAAAFLPAAVVGLLFKDAIKAHLFNPFSVAVALILGGIVIIAIESRRRAPTFLTAQDMTLHACLLVGCIQCLSVFPGTSRSAATIIGAMLLGASRPAAAQFSFYLAIPTMLGATTLEILDAGGGFTATEWGLLALGSAVSFATAWGVVAFLMKFVQHHNFNAFAYYRIALGALIILMSIA